MPPQNRQLWHKDYFELQAIEKKQLQEKLSSPYFPKSRTEIHRCVLFPSLPERTEVKSLEIPLDP